ncbi:hypothetical protein T265_07515 [Opisthorchis viverrini]|uniref:Uncharacterized protein n=1 Tax=Opisthorchis viverrini TaxID=6198 RepID=A0A074ZCQ5_OPIVI|nr:hypothetical protein T265_07515 [Opisthorchis viverrini]KER24953.1 hypothetical protein T265_07515 [Opisthorchis viverrini]
MKSKLLANANTVYLCRQKPKVRKSGKARKKRPTSGNEQLPSDGVERLDEAPIYMFSDGERCRACSPTRDKLLTRKLNECLSAHDAAKSATNQSAFSGWSWDLINLALFRPKKVGNAGTGCRTRTESKVNKPSFQRKQKSMNSLVVPSRPGLAPSSKINLNFRNSVTTATTARFKWLTGVSKSVHSRIVSSQSKVTGCNANHSRALKTKHRMKSFEHLLSPEIQKDESNVLKHLDGIGIICTPERPQETSPAFESPSYHKTSTPTTLYNLQSVPTVPFAQLDPNQVEDDQDDDEEGSLWFVAGNSIKCNNNRLIDYDYGKTN